ncbi:Intradiol ring-cleavage dioxygenase, core [Metarhizium rileyi]|uniref:Intradiol ring-cleavage dioxygenase, core n=1 Tax=Metarhizium rileyi (strain RCEF 4871) TaxID=1649241 RepID=A0A167KJL5_METRR|nr:Intradiol ring-cleavage dioxygenase, core [Metarhizium rileyi RCEF 4871]
MFPNLTIFSDVGGERIRKNVTEGQSGLDIALDYQVIDVDTCDPVPNVYVEIWHCNSTGVYSGIVAQGNGDSSDEDNINNTFLRGIQKTDSDGVAQFDSLFPGHYTGRTTHIHVMVHTNATELSNHTLGNQVYASHVGQAFFDQDLINAVEELEPYVSNTQNLTANSDDSILSAEADTVDPLMAYTLLGDSVADGLFAWLAFGINTSYVNQVHPASFYYQDGGVENPNGGFGGGPGRGGPPPTGARGGPGGRNSTSIGTGTSGGTVSSTSVSIGMRLVIV